MKISRVVLVACYALITHWHVQASMEACCSKKRARTFMYTRPLNQNLPLEQTVWHEFIYEKHCDIKFTGQMIGAFQESIVNNSSNSYFLFCHKNYLLAAGDASANKDNRDVRAEWLGLPNNFSGTLQLTPKQRQGGIFLEMHQDLKRFISLGFLEDYWVHIATPLIFVENKLTIDQQIGSTEQSVIPDNFISAFNRPELAYARIPQEGRSTIELAEIKVRIGKAYMAEDHYQIIYYSGASIPTSNKQNPKYVFDAVGGNNGHLGLIAGVAFQLVTSRCDKPYVSCFFLNVENLFLCHNVQYRTIDLIGKPWSRYMLLNKKNGGPDQNIPAANILTRKVSVHPYSMVDAIMGGRLFYGGCIFELGCNLWAHGREKVELKECFPAIWGIAGQKDDTNPGFATTASKSTITQREGNTGGQFDVDATGKPLFVPITYNDLDMLSAGTKESFTIKAYLSFGIASEGERVDGFIGVGGWYEIPHKQGFLMLAGGWMKFGASF